MRHGLTALMASQGGVIARHQALSGGYTAREFNALTRAGGRFVRVRYGVYTAADLWQSLDSADKRRLRDRAALLVCNDQTALSHSSAARFLKLPVYDVDDLSHVTRLGPGHGSRVQAGIKHHVSGLKPGDIDVVDGVRVTSIPRTVLDVSREFGYRSGLVTADGALQHGLSHADLLNLTDTLGCLSHAPVMRAVAQDARSGAQTPIETLGRILLTDMGITDLELQARIYFTGGGWADVDILAKNLRHLRDRRQVEVPARDRSAWPSDLSRTGCLEREAAGRQAARAEFRGQSDLLVRHSGTQLWRSKRPSLG